MKSYQVKIKFASNDEVHIRVDARNQADAIRRVEESNEFQNFAAEQGEIIRVEVIPEEIAPIDNSRFSVTNVTNKPGWYVVVDLDNRIKIEFKKNHFNDMQNISFFGKETQMDAVNVATALRQIADYMYENFKELI